MEFSKHLMKEMLGAYFETTFSKILPGLLAEALRDNDLFVAQDFVSIDDATRRYSFCRKTLYNCHNRQYIILHSSEGKTFVSIRELEVCGRHVIIISVKDISVSEHKDEEEQFDRWTKKAVHDSTQLDQRNENAFVEKDHTQKNRNSNLKRSHSIFLWF